VVELSESKMLQLISERLNNLPPLLVRQVRVIGVDRAIY